MLKYKMVTQNHPQSQFCPISTPLDFQFKIKLHNGKNCEQNSAHTLAQNPQKTNSVKEECCKCQWFQQKLMYIRTITSEIEQVKKINQGLREEIELQSMHFLRVMELVSENMKKGVEMKIKDILAEKDKVIKRQSEIIKKMEAESEQIFSQMQEQQQVQEELKRKISQLQSQRSYKNQNNFCPSQNLSSQSDRQKPCNLKNTCQISELMLFNEQNIDIRSKSASVGEIFQIKNTVQLKNKDSLTQKPSLSELKMQITKIKEKLIKSR